MGQIIADCENEVMCLYGKETPVLASGSKLII